MAEKVVPAHPVQCEAPQLVMDGLEMLMNLGDVLQLLDAAKNEGGSLKLYPRHISALCRFFEIENEFPRGTVVETTGEVTYFKGTVIGHYTTLEGHRGCAVQVLDSDSCKRVVHVNRNKHLRRVL